ncbi:MAG: asparagine synthase (glutamine-hydrolyzing) [Alphaproteobacteria bacterium]
MCGIAGLMTRNGQPPDMAVLRKLASALAHRGPDGERFHVSGNTGLVHRRLAIIDLEGGHQPLFGRGGTSLVANGEIYNDLQLRASLGNTAIYHTGSDCESILNVYDPDDAGFVNRLRGMYAFALHDPAYQTLTLARDPFGIKPLYIAQGDFGLAFASEISALVAAGFVPGAEDKLATIKMFELQFPSGDHPPVIGIERLPPGAVWTIKNGEVIRREGLPYWKRPIQAARSSADPLKTFDDIFTRSVELHLRSDVPFGLFLSGGIDSAAVLTAMVRATQVPVKAFTAYFPGTGAADERERAKAAAQSVGADHTEVAVTEEDFWQYLPLIAKAMDDPVADYAIVPTWLLAREARKSVTVVLSGEGGDELFAGYGRYRSAIAPWPLRKPMWQRGRFFATGLIRNNVRWRSDLADVEAQLSDGSPLQRAQRLDMAEWLANDLLVKLDRCLMAHGIEGRVPFLDTEVAEFALGLADDQKIHGKLGKWLLRNWVAEHMPAAQALAPKQGFTVPVEHWIAGRGRALGELMAKNEAVAAHCHPDAVKRIFANATQGWRAGAATWTLLFYALWHRAHIERKPVDGNVMDVLAAR